MKKVLVTALMALVDFVAKVIAGLIVIPLFALIGSILWIFSKFFDRNDEPKHWKE